MSDERVYSVIGGDMRSGYVAQLLIEQGRRVMTAGLELSGLVAPPHINTVDDAARRADIVILPLPLIDKNGQLKDGFSSEKIDVFAKLSCGVVDTPVTMAVKSHSRNGRPVVIAVSTNDGLAAASKNMGELINRRNYFFVPYYQDDCLKKPTSLVAELDYAPEAIRLALKGLQIQPILKN